MKKDSKKNYKGKNIIFCSLIMLSLFPFKIYAKDYIDNRDTKRSEINSVTSIVSKTETDIRKTPGIVSLITEEEIKNSGARDLQEVLQLIPGIVFNNDTENSLGFGIRGLWTMEGKALLIIDGQQINDGLWASVVYGNRFPVSNIKKVEVLRGPGSAIYGGNAELAVIKVTTKSAEDLNGLSAKVLFGVIPGDFPDYTHRNISLAYGQKLEDFNIVASGTLGLGNRSNKTFSDFYGNSFDMTGNAETNPRFFNIGIGYKDFSLRLLTDLYNVTTRDLYKVNASQAFPLYQYGYYGEMKYDYKITDRFTLTPKINYRYQLPWVINTKEALDLNNKDPEKFPIYYNKSVRRYTGNLTLTSDITDNINILAGTEFYNDYAEALNAKSANFGKDKKQNSASYNNFSAFTQGLLKTDYANLDLGARYENHTEYGSSFVPRVSVTSLLGNFHTKVLYSKAFRTPSIENIINFKSKTGKSTINPEDTTVMELEAGYQIIPDMFLTANIFDTYIKNPIVYYYDNGDSFDNFANTGTRGFEIDYKYKNSRWGYVDLNYSYYRVNDNKVERYQVPDHNDILLGFPTHKIVFNTSITPIEKLSVNPSLIFYSERYGYNSVDNSGNPVIKKFDPNFMLNLDIGYKDFFINGLNIDLAVYNLLNQAYYYITPYKSFHAPVPGPSTEISLNLSYDFTIEKKLVENKKEK